MAITVQIYSDTYGKSQTVTIDFISDFFIDTDGTDPNVLQHVFKFTTSSRDTSNLTYQPRYVKRLTDLALNHTKRSSVNSAVAYEDVRTMVTDYIYDMIYGHIADKYSSGCTLKAPMKFS